MIKHEAHVVTIAPNEARKIADEEGFHNQRKKLKAHISFLRETMVKGEFDGGEPIRFAVFAGARYLVNGQHRLEAIASGGGEQTVVVVSSHCDSVDEVAHLYASIDRGRGRSIGDALIALGKFGPDSGLSQQQIRTLMRCAPLFANDLRQFQVGGSSYASKSAEGRASVMDQWLEPAKRYFAETSGGQFTNGKMFLNRDAAAVGIATFADEPASKLASSFWNGMAMDDGLHANDPRKQCLEFVRKAAKEWSARARPGYIAHGVGVCWNAYFRGYNLKIVKVPRRPGALHLLGTRFVKREDDNGQETKAVRGGATRQTPEPQPQPTAI